MKPTAATVDLHDDLSDLLVRFHVLMATFRRRSFC